MKNRKSQMWRRILAAGAVALIAGCGGGGGGGSGGGGGGEEATGTPDSAPAAPPAAVFSGIAIQLTSSAEVKETAYVGADIPTFKATAAYTLTPGSRLPGTLYTRVTGMDARMYEPANVNLFIRQSDFTSGTGELTMFGVRDHVLPQGTYNTNVQVEVCINPECTVQVAGSPLKVKYTLEVQPSFELLATNVLNLRGVAGGQGTPVVIALNVPADTKERWHAAGPLDAAAAPITIGYLYKETPPGGDDYTKLSVTPTAAAVGTYQGRYLISWKGVESILVVNYTVTP